MRAVSCSASSSATSPSLLRGPADMARSMSARSTVSGVLSSWLASAVKRRRPENDCSRREIIAFSVSARRASSSSPSVTGNRRCSDRPSVMAETFRMIWSTGRRARPVIMYATPTLSTMMSGATMRKTPGSSLDRNESGAVEAPATTIWMGTLEDGVSNRA